MIVWLASYPRSGNTYLRIVLNRMYGVGSSVAYDFDGVARRLGEAFVGFEAGSADREAQRRSDAAHFIKTHRQCDQQIGEGDRAICLVRDGRDALVSWARLLSEAAPDGFEAKLEELIRQDSRGTGGWGANVLTWLAPAHRGRVVMRYEDLARAHATTVQKAMGVVAPLLAPLKGADIPEFSELSKRDAGFFRRGVSGGWRDEMPAHLHDLFWAEPRNREAMEMLGYDR